ncbi:hypothetical protein [Haliscomenobacter sp.]
MPTLFAFRHPRPDFLSSVPGEAELEAYHIQANIIWMVGVELDFAV